MLLAILKDLRMSKLKTFISGFSMFVGIIAVIASVMVGVLGREYLEAVNARISGWAPTYKVTLSLNGYNRYELLKLLDLLKENEAVEFTNDTSVTVARLSSNDLNADKSALYSKLMPVEIKVVSDNYDKIFNLVSKKGSWFNSTYQLSALVNEAAASYWGSDYLVFNTKNSLSLTPFRVRGIVSDGGTEPHIYVRASDLMMFADSLFSPTTISLYMHPSTSLSKENIHSRFQDLVTDTVRAKVDEVQRIDQQESYLSVIKMIEWSLMLSAILLLFVSILGQINIGLASLEQRTKELLIRRAIGASSRKISLEIFLSVIFVSVFVSLISIAFSALLLSVIQRVVLNDGVIRQVNFPVEAAVVAIVAAIITGIISGSIPAVKAARLEPALVLR